MDMVDQGIITFLLFISSYILSVTFTSVFYHRALCHNAMILKPWLKKFIYKYGFILTAIDPAIWICTHRMHHLYSDKKEDPHSPIYDTSLWQIHVAHLKYYSLLNKELRHKDSKYFQYLEGLDLSLHPWMTLPEIPLLKISFGNALIYLLHILFYYGIYQLTGSYSCALAVAAGLLSHPLQGTLVNYFGHIGKRYGGYRNFDLDDQSVNNTLIALFIFGEGYQNNHHKYPNSVKFSFNKNEYDFGYQVSLFLRKLKLVQF